MKYTEQIMMVGHRPFSEQISSMAAQTAPCSDILAARHRFPAYSANFTNSVLADSCGDVSSTGRHKTVVTRVGMLMVISLLNTHLTYTITALCCGLWSSCSNFIYLHVQHGYSAFPFLYCATKCPIKP